jgi:xylulokinase
LGLSEKQAAQKAGRDPYDLLAEEASRVEPGCEGLTFLPYLMGERTPHRDAAARAAFVGASARHGQAHFARAVFEGVTFGLLDSLRILRERKAPIKRVVATGGGAKSPFWLQMMADCFGTPVETVKGGEGPAFGAALLAMAGCGVYRGVREATKALVIKSGKKEPNQRRLKAYAEAGERFRNLYPALKAFFKASAQGQ